MPADPRRDETLAPSDRSSPSTPSAADSGASTADGVSPSIGDFADRLAAFAAGESHDTAGATPAPPPALPRVPGFEVLEVLGRGGMGVVYKARHLRLNRTVALKTVLHAERSTPTERIRFLAEAEAV
ncbi:MAG TPA: hypothetical protein VMZ71_04155, partial [Gemmataceae bacterium]|nr:hypothetical protein [Gemmataceae bacterium]